MQGRFRCLGARSCFSRSPCVPPVRNATNLRWLRCSGRDLNSQSGEESAGESAAQSVRAGLENLFTVSVNEPSVPVSSMQPTRWPSVDWSRYHLQLLFVDRSGSVRSRFAAGLFERIAEWNGWSRALIPSSCGLHADDAADEGRETSVSKMAAIFSEGSSLGLWTRGLARPVEMFDTADLDRYDLVLVLDRDLHNEMLSQVPAEHWEHYNNKICLLTCFSGYESEGIMLAKGGFALLPMQLSWILRQAFSSSKMVVDVPSPDFASTTSIEECSAMVSALILSCGGLCKYLMDSHPDDLPDYDPVD